MTHFGKIIGKVQWIESNSFRNFITSLQFAYNGIEEMLYKLSSSIAKNGHETL